MALTNRNYSYAELDEEYDYIGRETTRKKINSNNKNIQAKPKSKKKVKVQTSKRGTIIKLLIVVFAVCFVLLSKSLMINEQNSELLQLKKELTNLKKNNEQLKVNLESMVDLNVIERMAVEKLNMQYPDSKQIKYLQLNKSDFTEVKKATAGANSEIEPGILNAIKYGVTQVIGYLY